MEHQSDEISIVDIYRFLHSEWKTILIGTGVAAVLSVVVALISPSKYTAQVVVSPITEERGGGGASALLQMYGMGGGGSQDQAIAFIRSFSLVEEFVRRNDLLPILYADKWDSTAGRWKKQDDPPSLWMATKAFSEQIRSVNYDMRNTGLITLTVEWSDPVIAAEWANGLVKLADDILRQRALLEADQSITFLTEQATQTSIVGIQQAISNLIENEMKTATMARSRANYAFAVIDPAVPPERRSHPKRKLLVLLGTFFGGILAFIFVVARRFWYNVREQLGQETPAD